VLYAALRAGVGATGTCGTCKARRIAGVIVGDWAQAPGNAYLRADRDKVLLCRTRALGNCTFEIPGGVNLASTAQVRPSFGRGVIVRIDLLTQDLAVLGATLSEWITGSRGLGYLIQQSGSMIEVPLLWAAILVSMATGLAVFSSMSVLEYVALRWR
jgi:toluene monooxygenase electron transfer component